MTKPTRPVFNRGDLVRVKPSGWGTSLGLKPETYLAIVAEPAGDRVSVQLAEGIWIRRVNSPGLINWVRPSRLELVQRGDR